ncbi:MAG: SDR family NAD(P)-dependent oxidoreductase [Trueperaceae bacterium]
MTKKTVMIIGGTSGIGMELAKNLSKTNDVSIVGRNKETGEKLAKEHGLTFVQADVSKMAEVRSLAEHWRAENESLDLLIHSADVLRTERLNTPEGFELTFATNYTKSLR